MTRFDLKNIAERVFFSLDLDYAVVDVAEAPGSCGWKLTLFDATRARGRSIVDILVMPTATPSTEDDLADEIRRELTRGLGRPSLHRGPSQDG